MTAADAAYERFCGLEETSRLGSRDLPKLTEADTRAKLIDPLFKEVLGWREEEFHRETPVNSGFVDYTIGTEEAPYLLIEAKRTNPRFQLHAPKTTRLAKIAGPHLLKNRKLEPGIQQVAKYAYDLGAPVAVLTNGEQLIIFETRSGWTKGSAILWHGHDDIRENFAEFYALLSAESVRSGQLLESFGKLPGVTRPSYAPIEFVPDAGRELVRNRYWPKIARIFGPILTDQPEDPASQEEIIRNCYINTPISDESDANLDKLLQSRIPKFLVEAGVSDLKPGMHGKNAFDYSIESDVKGRHPGCYVLTGGVGSGKTTFLRRFALIVEPGLVREFCVWLHVDYLGIGNVSYESIDVELRNFTYKAIRQALVARYGELLPKSGEGMRALFGAALRDAALTRFYGISEGSAEWNDKVNAFVHELFLDDVKFVDAALHKLSESRRVVLVLDNSDQLGERFQGSLFLFAQRLSREHKALCIVALREEKFFAAYRRGIFDAFGNRRFHIGSPALGSVIKRRLEYGLEKYIAELKALPPADVDNEEVEGVRILMRALTDAATKSNSQITRMLACVSNGDMRHALDLVRDFVGSGNTDIDKILRIGRKYHAYTIPFHEFVKSAILGSRRFYQGSVSNVVNVFTRSSAPGASHFAAPRMLARLCAADGAASPHGEGFVETSRLIREYRTSFGSADDFIERGEELLRRGLVESEPPRSASITGTEALRISASGAYYWRFLVRSFAYLDLVFIDTAITDREVARSLGEAADSTDLVIRYDRVRRFVRFLESAEVRDLQTSGGRFALYRECLMREIAAAVEKEIKDIERKTSVLSA